MRQPCIPGLARSPRAKSEPVPEGPGSELERRLLQQIIEHGLPEPLREHVFDMRRQWRVDFAWPSIKLAVEVEGGIWTQGRHNRPLGFIEDCQKYNALAIQGWTLLRYPERMIRNGKAVKEIELVVCARI